MEFFEKAAETFANGIIRGLRKFAKPEDYHMIEQGILGILQDAPLDEEKGEVENIIMFANIEGEFKIVMIGVDAEYKLQTIKPFGIEDKKSLSYGIQSFLELVILFYKDVMSNKDYYMKKYNIQ